MGLNKEEPALILCDTPLRIIGTALFDKAVELGSHPYLVEMVPLPIHGTEPPPMIADIMKSVDVAVVPTTASLSHTHAREEANIQGTRIATLPGITQDIMERTLNIQYDELKERTEKIAALLTDAEIAHVMSEKGTDILISLKGRRADPDFGIIKNKGEFGNLPAGEAYIAPLEGKSDGVIVVDGAIASIGKVDDPVTITVKDGMATSIENCPELEEALDAHGPLARSVAELGVGTNEKATVTGNILEDEKAMGTVHIAMGNNLLFGGTVDVPVHLDCIILNPTLVVDDTIIIENGTHLI
jgi:leucyl aminopeptidase (aminopeptidase T)